MDVLRPRAELTAHEPDSFLHNALDRASPAGVKRAHHLVFPVHQQHRKAVSGEDGDGDAGEICDESISGQWTGLGTPDNVDDVRMDLAGRDQRPGFASLSRSRGRQESAPVFLDTVPRIFSGVT
jgi:hypothetical protein